MPDLTQPDPVDVALQVLLTQPSYAAQMLITTARLLDMAPTDPLTGPGLERAIDVAADAILRTLPNVVACDSMQRLYRALPDRPAPLTRGEYALRLRRAAKNLDALGARMDFTCCGRPMDRDGSQYVCGKCGSYTDPGTASGHTLGPEPADPDHGAEAAELLARCADDYAAAEAQRHAGDAPPLDPGLIALCAESAEATEHLDVGPA
ncbi:hypothetical protein [Streptomyces neyagawaensis]|uniref:hypothetical protein n=1 Tax=Streptomyces neyagawaensis TaxID=42238 RepID=UPI00201CF2AB|nr:hypothetical protein [Streptomyces neyagawaensis]MCL6733316.1 hypothetical protein [Streptomyces neyagawaensis]MDE1685118.1 hypothetical protein [Streptomyces neyagawaensis]